MRWNYKQLLRVEVGDDEDVDDEDHGLIWFLMKEYWMFPESSSETFYLLWIF